MGEVVISLNNVSKCFKRYSRPIDRLKEILQPKKSDENAFWALQSLSLNIIKGETLGIIGRNGSGKSTLLQIIAGTLTPTTGEVKVNGRVAALLELGSGFNPEFTGRQNVFFNGRLLGLTKAEIEANFDRIASFADIGDFLDQPVKTYSSGMLVRLAFSVQAHLSPDILIIDEALSVGDIFFQQKCARRLKELRDNGTTLLFVSHDMAIVRNLCTRAIYLKKGKLLAEGETKAVIREYLQEDLGFDLESSFIHEKNLNEHQLTAAEVNYSELIQNSLVPYKSIESEFVKVIAVNLLSEDGQYSLRYRIGDKAIFQLCLEAKVPLIDVHYTVAIHNRFDQLLFCGGSYTEQGDFIQCDANQVVITRLEVALDIEAGNYTFQIYLGKSSKVKHNVGVTLLETRRLGPFQVVWDYENDIAPFLGLFGLKHKSDFWTVSFP
jgi:lipopolysaccharide transport system ATP-binding protein